MDIHEIVKKLVGPIAPIGETTTDNEKFENLKVLCGLVENLIFDIDDMVYQNRDAYQYSVKRAAEFGDKFLISIKTVDE